LASTLGRENKTECT